MKDDYEYTVLQEDNFLTFTAGKDSVLKFSDMTGEELLSIKACFSLYVHLPFVLYPLIDYCKNNKDEFSGVLLLNLRRLLYKVRYKEDPQSYLSTLKDVQHLSPITPEQRNARLKETSLVDFQKQDPEAYSVLVETWIGETHFEQFTQMLVQALRGEIQPEVDLEAEATDDQICNQEQSAEELRKIRREMVAIAKADATTYQENAAM